MIIADVPTKLEIIWASGTTSTYVRAIPNTSSDPNAASLTLGFPPNTFVDVTSGGEPPDGRDWNGILQVLSAWSQWFAAGGAGAVLYDAGFSAAVGGYPKYAMLANAAAPGTFWISTVDSNTSDPDTGGANWSAFPPAFGSFVSSFNGRTGAVTLTSSDVVSALATNALANLKLALMPAGTIKSNLTGSPATPADNSLASVAAAMGFTANASTGLLFIPTNIGVFVRQWGTVGPVSDGSITVVSFAQGMTTPMGLNLTTLSDGGVGDNSMAQEVTGTFSGSGVHVKMQNFASGPGPAQPFRYEAWGIV